MGLYLDIVSFILCFLILIILWIYTKKEKYQKYIVIVALFITVFFIDTTVLEKKYNNSFQNYEEKLIVKIVSDKEEGDYYDKYVGEVENGKNKNLKILIYVKDNEFDYGDILRISGEISKPNKARNKNGFDYSEYLRQKKICAIIQIEEYEKLKIQKDFFYYIYKLKQICLERTYEMYTEKEAGFLSAILFGKTSDLDEEVREDFKLSNLSHVLAISGMHVSYVAIGIEKVFKIFIKNIKLRNFCIILFLMLFIPFVGGSASVMRACIMVIITYIAKILLQKDDFYSSFCIALFIILLINPYNISSISMWLSFGGSLGIVVFNNFLNKLILREFRKNTYKAVINIIEISLVSISAQIIIFPIMLYFFNTISISFCISNVLISFIVAPILILGYMSVILYPIGIILSKFEKIFIKLAFIVAQIGAKMPFNQIFLPSLKLYQVIIYYAFIFCLIYKFNKNKFFYLRRILNKKYALTAIKNNVKTYKKIFSVFILLIIILNFIKFVPNNLRINFLDVGQGDCTLLRTSQNKVILIDSGEGNSDKYDYGENVVFPYLLDEGIMKIDYMIISHFDSDHARRNVLYFEKYESKKYNHRKTSRRV